MAESSSPPPPLPPGTSIIPTETPSTTQEPPTASSAPEPPSSPPKKASKSSRIKSIPSSTVPLLYTQLRLTDSTVCRLSQLLSQPDGLSAFLSTANYTIYILAYTTRTFPTSSVSRLLRSLLHRLRLLPPAYQRPLKHGAPSSSTPSSLPLSTGLSNLGSLLSQTRTNLRLLSLPSYYTWLRSLLHTTNPPDQITHSIDLAQCISYIVYQILENLAWLQEKQIVDLSSSSSSSSSNGRSRRLLFSFSSPTRAAQILDLWSNRFWLLGLTLDLARLLRAATRESIPKQEPPSSSSPSDQDTASPWFPTLITSASWLPVALHYSLETGIPGMNQGIVGLCGLVAEIETFRALWDATSTKKEE